MHPTTIHRKYAGTQNKTYNSNTKKFGKLSDPDKSFATRLSYKIHVTVT